MKNNIIKQARAITLLLTCILFAHNARAQYVTIPDTNFVNWLDTSGYAGCLNGNQLDTTCSAVLNATGMSCNAVPIRDLTGVQYFKNLDVLDCSNDSLYLIPVLPSNLSRFNCSNNNLSSLPSLSPTMRQLLCNNNLLTSLPALPVGLNLLSFMNNQVTALSSLPDSLTIFWGTNNLLTSLPAMPPILTNLVCDQNRLTTIPALPATLIGLICNNNQITSLPALPVLQLYEVACAGNLLTTLPAMPVGLQVLLCDTNNLNSLPALPVSLQTLSCSNNQVPNLPVLPAGLKYLTCGGNLLSSIPVLPDSLSYLDCQGGNLTSLPSLPGTLLYLECSSNQLTSIPSLPDTLSWFDCANNPNLTCLPQLNIISYLAFNNTAITCLPDYGIVHLSTPSLNTVPLCGIINAGGCNAYWNIGGNVYYDANANCVFDSADVGQGYVKMQLQSSGFQQQVYSSVGGEYSFVGTNNLNYIIQPDTTNLPFIVSCPQAGYLTASLTAADSFVSNGNNFALQCRTDGVDVGAQSILANYAIPRPATNFTLFSTAGDMSELYGAHCAAGVAGQVELIFSGQVTYHGAATGALTPTTVNGNTLTWNINDFGLIDDYTAFTSLFTIDTQAGPGNQVCFTVHVTTTANDYNPANNTAYFCFTIVDALDPNEKEVSPAGNIDTAQWLTYTIRFQNTGSAPAQNVRVTDTLDNNLDPSTFQLTAFSAKNITQLFGNAVVFNFPNINLPDSLTSDSASRGYIQYKIKLKGGLQPGTQIQNKADIYFDLNPAVVTNTTTSTITNATDINPVVQNSGQLSINLYPNPANDYTIVETDISAIGGTLQITDVTGHEVMKIQISGIKTQIPVSALAAGVYVVKISDGYNRSGVRKMIVE